MLRWKFWLEMNNYSMLTVNVICYMQRYVQVTYVTDFTNH